MNRDELREFFLALLEKVSGADISRTIGYTPGVISALKKGTYNGGDDLHVLTVIYRIYGSWPCPVNDAEITSELCQAQQSIPYSANRVKTWAICQKCDRRSPGGDK